jgi:hypothetical protein
MLISLNSEISERNRGAAICGWCPHLILQRHFVTARSVTMDVMRPPPDDPKVCGQQKIVRWPLASA